MLPSCSSIMFFHHVLPSCSSIMFFHHVLPSGSSIMFCYQVFPSCSAIMFCYQVQPSGSSIMFSHQVLLSYITLWLHTILVIHLGSIKTMPSSYNKLSQCSTEAIDTHLLIPIHIVIG